MWWAVYLCLLQIFLGMFLPKITIYHQKRVNFFETHCSNKTAVLRNWMHAAITKTISKTIFHANWNIAQQARPCMVIIAPVCVITSTTAAASGPSVGIISPASVNDGRRTNHGSKAAIYTVIDAKTGYDDDWWESNDEWNRSPISANLVFSEAETIYESHTSVGLLQFFIHVRRERVGHALAACLIIYWASPAIRDHTVLPVTRHK